jgi:hypothetical protein
MESIGKKPRRLRSFTLEFKAEIVGLCRQGDRSVGQVARDFDLTETAGKERAGRARRGRAWTPIGNDVPNRNGNQWLSAAAMCPASALGGKRGCCGYRRVWLMRHAGSRE